MPRVLIIGASGQVGAALVQEYRTFNYLVYGTHASHPSSEEITVPFDLGAAGDQPNLAEELIDLMHPSIVIICAAFTMVDKAENTHEEVHRVNVTGPVAVASAARRIGAKLVVYSTDFVWDGTRGPYSEDDETNPVNVYGRSKVEMEHSVLAIDPAALVLRTTVVFGPEKSGKNFIYQICRNLMARKSMRVMTDQISTPTYNRDLATLTRMLVDAGASGVFNACGSEVLSRYAFAVEAAAVLGLDTSQILPCETSDLSQLARRPMRAGMRIDKAQAFLNGKFKPRSVKDAMTDWQRNPGSGNAPLGTPLRSHL